MKRLGRRDSVNVQMALLAGELAREEYLAGAVPTLAEIAVGPFVHCRFELDLPHGSMPHLEAWCRRLVARPGFRRHLPGREAA